MQHSFGDLRWYVDINEFIRVHGKEIDWDELVKAAFNHHIAKPVNYCLKFTQNLFGTNVPDRVLKELSRAENARDEWLFRKIRENDTRIDYLSELFMFDSLWDTTRFIFLSLITQPYMFLHFLFIFGKLLKQVIKK